ncbi:hypothetical protein MP228_002335 [Amoeboaphelidium protococcarum]|nr:hypothetical protein MP228_002335 [Amoeboaphelidium protococcarum]
MANKAALQNDLAELKKIMRPSCIMVREVIVELKQKVAVHVGVYCLIYRIRAFKKFQFVHLKVFHHCTKLLNHYDVKACSILPVVSAKVPFLTISDYQLMNCLVLGKRIGDCVTVHLKSYMHANEASDLRRKARNTDASQGTVGDFAQENCRNLEQRLDGTRLIGIDPGKKNVLVWGDEANVGGATALKESKREFKETGRISSGSWQRLALTTEFEAHLLYINPAEITLMEQEMAQSNSSQQYLGVYIRYFEDVYAFYPKSFHRSWRFRRLCKIKSSVWQCHFHDMWHPITSCTHCQNLFYLLEAIQTIDNKLDYAQSLRFCLHLFYLQWPAKTTCLNYM